MPFNQFEKLWQTPKILPSLKIMNMSYSKKLKKAPDFRYIKMVEKLCFRGCESLHKVHLSIGELINLGNLDMSKCSRLKKFPETIGQLIKLGQFDLHGCVKLKRLPQHINQLTHLSSLRLQFCTNLKQLPEKLGDMKGLKMIDASYKTIEQLPDSVVHLKKLVSLKLTSCRKIRKLPKQFGNMEGLKMFDASCSGIEELPDSIGRLNSLANLELSQCRNLASLPDSILELKFLKELSLNLCLKLERLPEQLGKMQSLEIISASETGIQELPDSILLLSRLKDLKLSYCKKLRYVPSSILNLTSLVRLHLPQVYMFTSKLPINYTKNLKYLSLGCDIRSWLPTILSFSSLRSLQLYDEGKSLSSRKCFNLSKLSNLEYLTLDNWGSSFLELPLNLKHLWLYNHKTLEQLPDLSNLESLKRLYIWNCIGLQSLPPLPLNLKTLSVNGCTSLKNVPQLSVLKKLESLRFLYCSNLKSVDMEQSYLQVQPPDSNSSSFSAYLPNREIAEWFDYKSSGSTVSFNIPWSVLRDDFLGIALWVVYKCKNPNNNSYIRAVITNKTEGIKKNIDIPLDYIVGEAQSKVQCTSTHKILMKSGDRIEVSFQKSLYFFDFGDAKIRGGELKVDKCGAHVVLKTLSTP